MRTFDALLRLAVAGLVSAVGCASSPAGPDAQAPVSMTNTSPAPTSAADAAAPDVLAKDRGVGIADLQDSTVTMIGLPAVREDTGEVALVFVGDDGGRGWAYASAVVVDAQNRIGSRVTLAEPGALNELPPSVEKEARARIAAFNSRFATGPWRTLPGAVGQWKDMAPPQAVVFDETTYAIDSKAKEVTVVRRGEVLVRQAVKLVDTPADAECRGDKSYLKSVHVDAARKRAFVELGAADGGHNCGAPPGDVVVVPVP
jgi:hypothetical protein